MSESVDLTTARESMRAAWEQRVHSGGPLTCGVSA